MRDALTIAGCTVRRFLHGWLLVVLSVGLATQLLVLLQGGPLPVQEALLNSRTFVLGVAFFSSVLLVLVAAGTDLPREIETGTILFILAKPVTRPQIILGKLLGLMAIGSASVLLQCLAGSLVLAWRGLPPDSVFMIRLVHLILRIWMVSGVAMFFSSLFSELPTLLFCALTFALGFCMNILDHVIRYAMLDIPIALSLRLLYYLLPNLNHLNASPHNPVSVQRLCLNVAYTLCYLLLVWAMACGAFAKREFQRGQR